MSVFFFLLLQLKRTKQQQKTGQSGQWASRIFPVILHIYYLQSNCNES